MEIGSARIADWCNRTSIRVKARTLSYFEADATKLPAAVANVAAVVPGYYATPQHVAHILATLGKSKAAAYIRVKLPVGSRGRSGDIGEILASDWVKDFTRYRIGIHKLRWKDHREMAMRGDDILALSLDPDVDIRFLKGEVKSRASLTTKTVEQARAALLSSNERPTPHALSFVSDRLLDAGEAELFELINKYQLKKQIKPGQLSHLMFMFTGNDPSNLLTTDLEDYKGKIEQYSVGLRVHNHQMFIKQVFEKVAAGGKNS